MSAPLDFLSLPIVIYLLKCILLHTGTIISASYRKEVLHIGSNRELDVAPSLVKRMVTIVSTTGHDTIY